MKDEAKKIQNIKNVLEKDHGREFSWEEATQAHWDMKRFAELLYEMVQEEHRKQNLLKENPNGFHLDGAGASCLICSNHASGENSWFDKNGLKCMPCQKAIDAKIIPASVINNNDSWYSKYDLESYFNIKGADLNRYIKQSLLKSRIIPSEGKKVHFQMFLIKDNKDVLPPKKLFQSRPVKIMRNGEEYFTTEYWYEYLDEKLAKRLAKYKIIECLKETFTKPMNTGRFLHKGINPLFSYKTPPVEIKSEIFETKSP